MKKPKIWVIFCDYEEVVEGELHQRCSLLDMTVEDAPASIKDMAEQLREIEAYQTSIHASFFQFMQMQNPKVVAVPFPPIKTEIGRRQLTEFVRYKVDAELPDRDFETLFQGIKTGSKTGDRGSK